MVCHIILNGTLTCAIESGGLYGALDNANAKIKVDWITGEGLLKVKSVGFAITVR